MRSVVCIPRVVPPTVSGCRGLSLLVVATKFSARFVEDADAAADPLKVFWPAADTTAIMVLLLVIESRTARGK